MKYIHIPTGIKVESAAELPASAYEPVKPREGAGKAGARKPRRTASGKGR